MSALLTPFVNAGDFVGAVRRPSEHVGRRGGRPRGSLVGPDGSPGASESELQLLLINFFKKQSPSRSSGLQPARPRIGPWTATHPENHGASWSDTLGRSAPASLRYVLGGCRAIFNESEGFPANLRLPSA